MNLELHLSVCPALCVKRLNSILYCMYFHHAQTNIQMQNKHSVMQTKKSIYFECLQSNVLCPVYYCYSYCYSIVTGLYMTVNIA